MRRERVDVDGAESGLACELVVADADDGPWPTLLAIDVPSEWDEALVSAGFALARVDVPEGPDRQRLADTALVLRALRERPDVDAERVAALGCGVGGTLAYLLGCHSDGLEAVVDVGGGLVYPELDARRPMQPLEMALNLSAPLLFVHGTLDENVPTAHVRDLERTLDQFAKRCETVAVGGVGPDFFRPAAAGYDEAAVRTVLERTLAFLRSELDLEAR